MKMFLSTAEELMNFLYAQEAALILCLFYDLLKSITPKTRSRLTADFFDGLIWFLICTAFLVLWQELLAGELRWYTLLSFFSTLLLYFLTIHKPVFSALCIIVKKIYSFFHTILKILLTVWHFFSTITIYVSAICKKIYSVDYKGSRYEK